VRGREATVVAPIFDRPPLPTTFAAMKMRNIASQVDEGLPVTVSCHRSQRHSVMVAESFSITVVVTPVATLKAATTD
jgi:hypothetical protein